MDDNAAGLREWTHQNFKVEKETPDIITVHCIHPDHGKVDTQASAAIMIKSRMYVCQKCGSRKISDFCKDTGLTDPYIYKSPVKNKNARYDYIKNGELLYYKVRTGNKKYPYLFKKPDGTDKLPPGVVRTLYHHDEGKEALDEGKPIIICEGEKDADRLIAAGYTAVSSDTGAGEGKTWKPEYYDIFNAGDTVYISPDSDKPGQIFMQEIAKKLQEKSINVYWIDYGFEITESHGKDVSDWFNEGHTQTDFEKLITTAKLKTKIIDKLPDPSIHEEQSERQQRFTLTSLMNINFPVLKWYVDRIITTGLTLLWGAAKSGKSILILHILLAISQGGRALGVLKCKQAGVMLISLEDGPRRLQTRLKAAGAIGGNNFHIFTEWPRGEEGITRLSKYLEENTDIKIVVIDTLFLLTKIQDGNDYSQTVTIMEILKRIADDLDISIIVIHHSKKLGKDKPGNILETSLGSTGIVAGADHLLYLERTPSSPSDATLHFVSKDAEPAELALRFDNSIMGWSYQGEASDIADTDERQDILDLLRKEGALKPGEIADKLGKKQSAISRLLKKMIDRELIWKIHYGLYCLKGSDIGNSSNSGNSKNTGNSGNSTDEVLPLLPLSGGVPPL